MKALLEKSKIMFQLTTQLPSLNLRLGGPQFYEHFKEYRYEKLLFQIKSAVPL